MKSFFFTFLLFPFFAFCQSNGLTKKEFIKAGSFSTFTTLPVTVNAVKITEINTVKKVSGIEVSTAYASSFIENQDIDDLIGSLEKMKEIIKTQVPANYTEYIFLGKGDFKVLLYSGKKEWSLMIVINRLVNTGGSVLYDKADDSLIKLSDYIKTAKSSL